MASGSTNGWLVAYAHLAMENHHFEDTRRGAHHPFLGIRDDFKARLTVPDVSHLVSDQVAMSTTVEFAHARWLKKVINRGSPIV